VIGQAARRLEGRLACPDCRVALAPTEGGFRCTACGAGFRVSGGVPLLLPPARAAALEDVLRGEGASMAAEYRGPAVRRWLDRLRPPSLLLPLEPDPAAQEMDFLYLEDGQERLVLSVGGGPTRHRPSEINLNLAPFPNVDVVADAHRLPMVDGSIDTVICKAVLEHVESPQRVMAEIARVLRPGGLVYLDVPFLFIDHAYPQDFARFTRAGVRQLVDGFEILRMGASIGPVSTLLLLANDALLEVLGVRGKGWGRLVSGVFRALFFPLKYLDLLLRRSGSAPAFAGAYHVVARKLA
jgi:uncharacterized protein YbaR (Trm112 family)